MKMKTSQKVHYDSGPNMTPLVDVVMVILIFLMLTGSFAAGEWFLQSNVPYTMKGAGEVKDRKAIPDEEPMEIRVRSQTELAWSADVGGRIVRSDADELERTLKGVRDQFRAAGKNLEKIQVVITPNPGTRYQHLIDVYRATLGAEFTKIGFAKSQY